MDTQPAEFYVLEGEEASAEPAWEDFQTRFVRSAVASGFTRTIADGLSAALQEMADNACLHARSPVGALVVPGLDETLVAYRAGCEIPEPVAAAVGTAREG